MAKLILTLDGSVIREAPLDKEKVTIGRKASNDIQIENLAVSGEHARIVTILNDSFLEDLGSTNGTLVNGMPVKKHILQDNDIVEIGKYKLKFVAEAAAAGQAPAEDFERTMVLRAPVAPVAPPASSAPSAAPAASAAPVPKLDPAGMGDTRAMLIAQPQPSSAPAAAPAAPPPPVVPIRPAAAPAVDMRSAMIQILSGPGAGKELPLVKTLTTLGKPGVQVAVITKRPQGYFITHVEGANFPIVNGTALGTQAHALADHDVVEIAGVKMEFFLRV
jgi:pSer/pThr/pTyr-binding forkhead associated (FHA) protein